MSVDTTEKRDSPAGAPTGIVETVRAGLRALEWQPILLFGVAAGILMPLILTAGSSLFIVGGVVPVLAGLLIGRRVKGHYWIQGLVTGLIAAAIGLFALYLFLFFTPLGEIAQKSVTTTGPDGQPVALALPALYVQLAAFTTFSLILFITYGAWMTGRTQARNQASQDEIAARGGRLERPSAVRTADDVRGLSLPQFGGYINALFKKQGFTLKDYKFIDKDKHLDIQLERDGEPWLLRLTVLDKVSTGTIEGLHQKMKEEGVRKGVVIASTEFLPSATKAAKGRPIVLIDGPTLFEIAE